MTLSTPRSDAAAVQLEVGDPAEGGVPVRLIATGLPHGEGRFYGLWLPGAQGVDLDHGGEGLALSLRWK